MIKNRFLSLPVIYFSLEIGVVRDDPSFIASDSVKPQIVDTLINPNPESQALSREEYSSIDSPTPVLEPGQDHLGFWHLLQKATSANEETHTKSMNQLFKETNPAPHFKQFIEDFQLGIRRKHHYSQNKRSISVQTSDHVNKVFDSRFSLFKSVFDASEVPSSSKNTPEILFTGRSNVGKSSLLNSLTRTPAAIVKNHPGTTKSLNFFSLGSYCYIVDAPGQGFAFASQERLSDWAHVYDRYLSSSTKLKLVVHLLDARHGIKYHDQIFFQYLARLQIRPYIVLTKCDLVSPKELAKRATVVENRLVEEFSDLKAPRIFLTVGNKQHPSLNPLRTAMCAFIPPVEFSLSNLKVLQPCDTLNKAVPFSPNISTLKKNSPSLVQQIEQNPEPEMRSRSQHRFQKDSNFGKVFKRKSFMQTDDHRKGNFKGSISGNGSGSGSKRHKDKRNWAKIGSGSSFKTITVNPTTQQVKSGAGGYQKGHGWSERAKPKDSNNQKRLNNHSKW